MKQINDCFPLIVGTVLMVTIWCALALLVLTVTVARYGFCS